MAWLLAPPPRTPGHVGQPAGTSRESENLRLGQLHGGVHAAENPGIVAAERERLGLLPDLPEDLEAQIDPYFEQAVGEDMFPNDGGGETAARSDFGFYSSAGQLEGDPETLKVEDFWYLEPLEKARAALQG